ncbi:hypothetical protein [Gelidibacter salicanalis]|nr:hypothetical protein [Gelidibacter salicanalis]
MKFKHNAITEDHFKKVSCYDPRYRDGNSTKLIKVGAENLVLQFKNALEVVYALTSHFNKAIRTE